MTNTLYIDTSNKDQIIVRMEVNGKVVSLKGRSKKLKAQQVLPLIDKGTKKLGIKLRDIDRIKINPGPGSFTGLRVGFAVANTIGWLLNVSINGGKTGWPTIPVYNT